MKLAEDVIEKSTFICKYGTNQFEVMAFGLMNAPSTFQRTMDFIFAAVLFIRICLDGIGVFLNGLDEHLEHLDVVLTLIAKK